MSHETTKLSLRMVRKSDLEDLAIFRWVSGGEEIPGGTFLH